jgi:viroplasmin and RNaseH domain-containing protein
MVCCVSWGVCSEYVLGFSGAAYQDYLTRMEPEEAYAAFLATNSIL